MFIFPHNYNFNSKLFANLDYLTLIFNLSWDFIIFFILHFLVLNFELKILFFISLCFPLFIFSAFGFRGENIINVLFYLLKFIFSPKIYLYTKH